MSDGRLPVKRRWIRWAICGVLAIAVLAIAWVTVRGIGAVNDLQQVAARASTLKHAIGDGDVDAAAPLAKSIAHHAKSARELTSDPIWHAFALVPWLGSNFTAVGEIAEIADDVVTGSLDPLLDVAGEVTLGGLAFTNGTVDMKAFAGIEKPLRKASATLTSAEQRTRRIDVETTLPPLADAVHMMRATVTEAATVIGSLHGAAVLLPAMLGQDGPRNYVIAMQNNAELRSSGGIIGSLALLHAEGGRITIGRQAATPDFPPLDAPLALSDSTVALFDDQPGRYMQNLTSVPDFAEAGQAIATRWKERFGDNIDGVIAVDAVVAKNLMKATGGLTLGPYQATAKTVLSILLSKIYAEIPDPKDQDKVFAAAASGLFTSLLSSAHPKAVVGALAKSAAEGRIRVWSAHDGEQRLLGSSALGGTIPHDGAGGRHVGVLLNDTTGGKMDYYAKAKFVTAIGTCDGKPTTQVRVTLTNTAPADAATTLPEYVTAGGHYGVAPGAIRTLVAIYGPEHATVSHSDLGGSDKPVQTTAFGPRAVVQHETVLGPGESVTITLEFQGKGAGERLTSVLHTPMIDAPKATREKLTCAP